MIVLSINLLNTNTVIFFDDNKIQNIYLFQILYFLEKGNEILLKDKNRAIKDRSSSNTKLRFG